MLLWSYSNSQICMIQRNFFLIKEFFSGCNFISYISYTVCLENEICFLIFSCFTNALSLLTRVIFIEKTNYSSWKKIILHEKI